MAKKRPMTNAERVRKHRAKKANKRQINLTLNNKTVAKLDRQAKQSSQTRSEFVDTLIASGNTKQKATPKALRATPVAKELSTEDQQIVLQVLSNLEDTYLQQIVDDVVGIRQMRRAINRMTKALQEQNPELIFTSNEKNKSGRKKARTRKTATTKRSRVTETLDAIGLARESTFTDFAGAVSVRAEIKDFPSMTHDHQKTMKWRDMPRKFMAVREVKKQIETFRKKHSDATIKQRYMTEDKTIREITATYKDDRPNHRIVYQARNR